ncbi:MAG: hypothetical protein JWQ27_1533 [Ferruginibacter sp.]|nr:hypothetical protein [Ferruginibacter sp.]
MIRLFLYSFFLSLPFSLQAQGNDFISLKKKGRTIKNYYAGTHIEFMTTTGAYRNALITKVQHDSIFLQEFLVRQLPTTFGTYILDTAGSFRFAYHYKQIKSFGKTQKGFNMQGSGSSLFGGGILLTLASGVVYIADRDKFSPALMGAAAGLAALGYMMTKSGSKGIVVGKRKYELEYVNMTSH